MLIWNIKSFAEKEVHAAEFKIQPAAAKKSRKETGQR